MEVEENHADVWSCWQTTSSVKSRGLFTYRFWWSPRGPGLNWTSLLTWDPCGWQGCGVSGRRWREWLHSEWSWFKEQFELLTWSISLCAFYIKAEVFFLLTVYLAFRKSSCFPTSVRYVLVSEALSWKAVARSVRMWMNAGDWVVTLAVRPVSTQRAPTPAPVILATHWSLMAIPVKQQVNGAANISSTVGWELEVLWHPGIPMQISFLGLKCSSLLCLQNKTSTVPKPPFYIL